MFRKRSKFWIVVTLALYASFVAASWGRANESVAEFDIPPQSLDSALLVFAEQADVQVSVATVTISGMRTQGVVGWFTPSVALARLLTETGLQFTTVGDRTYSVSQAGKTPARERESTLALVQGEAAESSMVSSPQDAEVNTQSSAKVANGKADLDDVQDEVIVTGTHIRGVNPQSSPLSIYTAEEIRRTGVTTIEQFIEKLPQNHGSVFGSAPSSTATYNPESATGVDLRGLGIGTTLVLLNGRRLALAAGGRTADISMIPLGTIERVEVLSDGASGIYGADAIGGVVNLVLKDSFEGAQTDLGYGSVTDGGLRELRFEQTFGHQWGSGRGVLSYHYLDREDLDASERDFAASAAPYTLVVPDRRHNVFLTGHQDGPAGTELFGDALFSSRETSSFTTHLAGAGTNRMNTDETQYFTDLGARTALTDSIGGEIVASYALLKSEFRDAGTFSGEPADSTSDYDHSVVDVTAKLDGDVLAIRGGMLKFSVGGGYTEERYVEEGSFNSVATTGLRADRNTKYVFGEVFAPFLSPGNNVTFAERLEFSLSARYTDYSDFGAETSPRVGLLWGPTAFLDVRATYSESFRAPSLVQLNPAGSLNVIFPPAAFGLPDPFSNDGSTVVLVPQGLSSAGLDPERAETYTAGFDLHPQSMPSLKLSATYFKIDYRGRILRPFVFLEPFFTPEDFSDIIYVNPDAALIGSVIDGSRNVLNTTSADPTDPAALATVVDVILDNRTRNLALTKMDGLDFSVAHRGQRSFGALSLGAQLTYIFDFDQQTTANSPVLSVVDTVMHPAALKGRAYLGLSRGIWSGQLNLNYVDRYENPFANGPTEVPSWTTLDLSVTCDLGRNFAGAFANTGLSLSVQNLLDRDPPFVALGTTGTTINEPVGYDPSNADPIGRFIALQASKAW